MATVTVFSKEGCRHCAEAVEYLKGARVRVIKIETPAHRAFLVKLIGEFKTYPQIFINDALVSGGNSGLRAIPRATLDILLRHEVNPEKHPYILFGEEFDF